uniref:Uncharacterized protein n=1 Tax=Arundo donax TaxID=35708 RepID=A0A0A9APA1_ARUDO
MADMRPCLTHVSSPLPSSPTRKGTPSRWRSQVAELVPTSGQRFTGGRQRKVSPAMH